MPAMECHPLFSGNRSIRSDQQCIQLTQILPAVRNLRCIHLINRHKNITHAFGSVRRNLHTVQLLHVFRPGSYHSDQCNVLIGRKVLTQRCCLYCSRAIFQIRLYCTIDPWKCQIKCFLPCFPCIQCYIFLPYTHFASGIIHIIADHRQTLSQIRLLIAGNRYFHLQLSFKRFPMICQCCRNRQADIAVSRLAVKSPVQCYLNVVLRLVFCPYQTGQQQDQQYQYYSPDIFSHVCLSFVCCNGSHTENTVPSRSLFTCTSPP